MHLDLDAAKKLVGSQQGKDLEAMTRGQVVTPESALEDAHQTAGAIGGATGECVACTPEPCSCDRTPAGPDTESILPLEMQSQGNLFETEAWREFQATQGKTPKLMKRKEKKVTEAVTETKKKRAGGLPSNPEPIEEWVPPTPVFQEEEIFEGPSNGGPTGPTANQAFRAQVQDEEGEEQEDIDPIEYIQANFEGAPSDREVEIWRDRHGDVFVTLFTDDEVFIWRTVRRLEYKNIMSMVAQADQAVAKTQGAAANIDEGRNARFIEELCKRCVLWPEINADQLSFSKAGSFDALANLILEASNFIPHGLAMRLTRKL